MTISIHDAAAAVVRLKEQAPSTSFVHRALYIAQGWTLGLTGESLFPERFLAAPNGPHSQNLFDEHGHTLSLEAHPAGSADVALADPIGGIVLPAVVRQYGALTGLQLSEMDIVRATPWRRAFRAAPYSPIDEALIQQVFTAHIALALPEALRRPSLPL